MALSLPAHCITEQQIIERAHTPLCAQIRSLRVPTWHSVFFSAPVPDSVREWEGHDQNTCVYPLTLLGWPVSRSIPSTHLPGRHESPIGYPFLPTIMLVCVCIPPWTLCNGFMRGNSCPRREPGRSSPVRDVRNLGKISSADVLMVCERQCYLHITWSGAFAFFLLNERLKSRT